MRTKIPIAFSLVFILSLPNLFLLPAYPASIFTDGFESGDFLAWSKTNVPTGTIVEVVSSPVHHGSYAAHLSNGGVDTEPKVWKDFTAMNRGYARVYVRFANMSAVSNSRLIFFTFGMGSHPYESSQVSVHNLDGTFVWRLDMGDDSGNRFYAVSSETVTTNTWYCVEVEKVADSTVGESRLFIDGTEILNITGKDTELTGQCDRVVLDGESYGAVRTTNNYFDCAVVDSNYISPEPSDSIPPTLGTITTNTTTAGQSCSFNCLVNDNTNVSTYIFSTNNTGTWTNDTAIPFSIFFNETAAWANVTKTLDDTVRNVVSYLWYANDTSNNWSNSDQYNLTLTAPYRPNLQMTPDTVTCRKYLEKFDIQINITNAINIQAFSFTIYYDPSVLNYSSVSWCELGTGTMTEIDTTNGILEGNVANSPITGNHWLLNITFQADKTIIWKDGLTNKLEGKIWFRQAQLNFTDNSTLQYVEGGINQIEVNQAAYTFLPIQGDVNSDETVDVLDLRTVAFYYDKTPADPEWPEASKYDLKPDNTIDIFDLIIVASNIGFKYP